MKTAGNPIELWPIERLQGAEYNPRKMVPERLEQVKTSLLKLGFVLPIYVTSEGLILSGHQRTTAARMAGYTQVPVVVLALGEGQHKGLNVTFNKGTNDLDTYETNAKDVFAEYLEQAGALLEDLPDIEPDTYYPCMETRLVPVKDLLKRLGEAGVSENLRAAGRTLVSTGIHMPIVISGDRVINGKGRIFGYFSGDFDEVPVVELAGTRADYAFLALNFLAMDFDIQANFKEELRFNAFRRRGVQAQIVGLSRTYPYFVYNRVISNTAGKYLLLEGKTNPDLELLPTANEESRKAFAKRYGNLIFDMGAGLLHDARLMQQAGFDLVPFEPYYCGDGSEPDSDASRALVAAYLDRMEGLAEAGKGPDSIISSFVLNSVPHHRDRMAYLTILAAMARYDTGVFIGTQSVKGLDRLQSHLRLNSDEPNITLGNDTRYFKAQKFYYREELERMLKPFFATVTVKETSSNLFAECRHPRRPSRGLLKEALELEFNLPYKDGTTMALADRAKSIFGRYLRMDLS